MHEPAADGGVEGVRLEELQEEDLPSARAEGAVELSHLGALDS